MSWFAMSDWPGNRAAESSSATTEGAPTEPRAPGRLERFDVEIELPPQRGPGGGTGPEAVTVPVTVWLPPGYDGEDDQRYPAVYSLERYAIPIGDWSGTLDQVVGDRVAPLIAVMIDPPSGFYGRRGGGRVGLLVPGVVSAVDRRFRTLDQPEQRAVVGAYFSGPPALALSLGEDRLFGRVAVQSPFALDATLPMHRQQIERARAAPRPEVFYFEWARWEMRSPGEGIVLGVFMRQLHDLFVEQGYDVIGGEVWDSTDWAGWRNRIGLILEALFPSASGDVSRGLARWLVEPKD